ncbi:MAG TPA: hypothetical protein VGK53_11185 [Propionicimonas sp.]
MVVWFIFVLIEVVPPMLDLARSGCGKQLRCLQWVCREYGFGVGVPVVAEEGEAFDVLLEYLGIGGVSPFVVTEVLDDSAGKGVEFGCPLWAHRPPSVVPFDGG